MQSQKIDSTVYPEMRRLLMQRPSVQRLLAATMAAIGAVMAEATVLSVQAASLTKWSFDPAANQLEITVKDGTTPRYFLMAQPARIVLDLPDTAIGSVSAQQTYAGAVRQIRVSQFEPGLTRIVMEISPGVSLAPGQVKLQKVGSGTAPSGDSRWVLQPLITKSLSANAVRVNPSASSPARPTVSAPAANVPATNAPAANVSANGPAVRATKPLETKPSIAPSPPAKVTRAETERPPSQAVVPGSNVPSKPATTNASPSSNATAASQGDRKPTVVVPDLAASTTPTAPSPATSAPPAAALTQPAAATNQSATPPVALAPVLPSSSTPVASPVPPSPPSAVTPIDPNVAVDTQRGVAIAVPTPSALATVSGVPPQPPAASPQPASPQPANSQPANSQPTPRVEPSGNTRPLAATKPTAMTPAIAPRSTPAIAPRSTPPIVQPSRASSTASTSARSTTAEIPTTLAAAPTASPPSVSVPPLNPLSTPSGSPSVSEAQARDAQVRQPEAAFDIPSVGSSAASTQPSVSVPPPIRVGTPSLGTANGTPSAVEAAPISVFAPNASLEPPVSVPPLQQTPLLQQPDVLTTVPIKPAQTSYDANTIRQTTPGANLAPPLDIVPLQTPAQQPTVPSPTLAPGYDANTIKQPPSEPAPTSIVEFGQPLPAKDSTARTSQPFNTLTTSQGVRQAFKPTAPDVLLPAGTVLNLRYPGDATLLLQTDRPQQEVLVLLTELRDVTGNLLAPAGSAVTGRFETTTSGSQFVAQAIAVAGRTIPLTAQSDMLDGSRKVQGNNLAVNSGIGLVAGGVLGAVSGSAGLGALGGAAAGAAATLITAPKPAAIQPGQVVQVRLTQDLRSFE